MDSQKALRFGICGKNCMRQNELDYALETTLVDAGPTLAMAALGANVQQLKDALQALARQPLMQANIVRHTDLTNRAAFSLVQACLEAGVQPGLIANVFLYYWLRASTINANVPEPFFQTAEAPLGHGDGAGGRLHRHAGTPGAAVGRASRRGAPWRAPLLQQGRPVARRALPRVLARWGVPGARRCGRKPPRRTGRGATWRP
jgi:hypothetical protein